MHVKNVVRQSTAAARLGNISRTRIQELIRQGELKTVEVDGVPHVTLKSLNALIKKRARQKAST